MIPGLNSDKQRQRWSYQIGPFAKNRAKTFLPGKARPKRTHPPTGPGSKTNTETFNLQKLGDRLASSPPRIGLFATCDERSL